MFNNRINKLGFWAPDVEDNFVNRTGVTLTLGDVVALDFTGSDADVDTMTEFLAETAPDLAVGPLANVIAVSASNDKGWMYVVCLDVSVADNATGRFGIIGNFAVKLAPGTGVVANVSNGDRLVPVAGQKYLASQASGYAICGLAFQDGPTAAAAATKKVLFNGFASLYSNAFYSSLGAVGVVTAKTADYTVLAGDTGTTFTTVGAGGTIVFAMPAATVGLRYKFRVGAAQALRIDPNGTEVIALPSTGVAGAAGKYLGCSTDGATVSIECTKAGTWSVFGFTGTWVAEA